MSSAKDLAKDFVRLLKAKTRRKDSTSSNPPPATPVPQASGEGIAPITSIPPPQRKGASRLTRIFSSKSAGPTTGTRQIEASDAHPGLVRLIQLADSSFGDYFELAQWEPSTRPIETPFQKQVQDYQWQEPSPTDPSYPPCLSSIPKNAEVGLLRIFDLQRLIDVAVASFIPVIPPRISNYIYGKPMQSTMAGMEARNNELRLQKKNIGQETSIANRPDWFTDAVFAQQSFTGPNPTTITLASAEWIARFAAAAKRQSNQAMQALLVNSDPGSVYIQDYSYFREAIGAPADAVLTSNNQKRFGCAAVTLFHLTTSGVLHPLAIVIDYRINMENSVVIFNRRLRSTDSTAGEANDWAWRFAKLCNQVSDWSRHELAIHLNDCHFVEEATIVAAQRSIPATHIVHTILEPHWLKTLSLNAAARSILVPKIVVNINGFTSSQTYEFVLDAYKRFDWTAHYIPNQLKNRGFPPSQLNDKKFHNYAWARNMPLMWQVLRNFVQTSLRPFYSSDADVAADKALSTWSLEMRSPTGGQMPSFPELKTLEELLSTVVMCIHIASPEHNSVNYLQNYYMSFVPNKPASLMAPLPQSLEALMAYTEKDMIKALPVKDSHVWLMSSQLPYMLSYAVAEDQTLLSYARELEDEAREKKAVDPKKWDSIEAASKSLYDDLLDLGVKFNGHSQQMDDQIVAYRVMDPTKLAVSVLI